MENKINKNKIEMNEHNVRLLLDMIMSILTDEQVEKLNSMISSLQVNEKKVIKAKK